MVSLDMGLESYFNWKYFLKIKYTNNDNKI